MDPRVPLDRAADFSDDERGALRALSLAVYSPEMVANWIGRHLEWASAEWGVRVWGEDGELASFVGIHLRQATFDGHPVRVGGVGGVKTHPAARRRGHAALGLGRAIEFFHEQADVAFALLVCEPHLTLYYGRLGWREFGGRLLVRQFGVAADFTLMQVMTHGISAEGPTDGVVDLCGPPW